MSTQTHKLLLVDDEQDILEFLTYNLRKEGYHVSSATNGDEALTIARRELPDLVLLDVMMPGLDGIEVCRELRQMPGMSDVLIAFLTARAEDYSHIAGFEAGADDYINKPIKPRVLISRIKALLRRAPNANNNEAIDMGGIRIDRESYLVYKNDQQISLPRKEFELIALLATKPGKVFTREEILNNVWGGEVIVGDRTIDVHIRKLREKLGEEFIKTVKGVGYKFEF
ncbi:MAG: response regulator transcription factor [Bacteroidia bacterium]|jgi:two-component system alkaline phosphatase synthesis response regulator PhoP|nr:response regulator transcription factor [Bacteroidia bacterium]